MVIYTDKNKLPLGELRKYSIDLDIGNENDFELQMNLKNNCMTEQSIWYVDGTEYGGIVDAIKIDTEKEIVYYSGRSWRGILQKKILCVDAGKDYYTVSGDANDILREIIKKIDLFDFFNVPSIKSNIIIQNYQFERYIDAYTGIKKMLEKVKAKILITMKNGMVNIEAVPIMDLSEKYEYSDDYGMKVIMETNQGGVNHLICLGGGELKDRVIIHLYVDNLGNIGKTQHFTGLQEITETYDYGNSELESELEANGIEKLEDLKSRNSISAVFEKLDVTVGDIVGGKNRITKIELKETVNAEIIKIKNDTMSITYKVGEK